MANLNDATAGLFADNEADLVDSLTGLAVDDVSSAMQQWATYAKDSLTDPADPEPATPKRSLHLSKTLDGRRELSGSLDPETGAETETALRLAQTKDGDEEPSRAPAERRADAFADIMRFFLEHQQTQPGGRHTIAPSLLGAASRWIVYRSQAPEVRFFWCQDRYTILRRGAPRSVLAHRRHPPVGRGGQPPRL